MRISVIAVGKLKERFWREAADEYLKRLQPYATVTIREVADRDPARSPGRALDEEAADIERSIGSDAYVIALALDGRPRTSEEFAELIAGLQLGGRSSVDFIIGGSDGLAPSVLERADEVVTLGPLTMPHNLARVVLLEQLYRAFKIIRNEPYHK